MGGAGVQVQFRPARNRRDIPCNQHHPGDDDFRLGGSGGPNYPNAACPESTPGPPGNVILRLDLHDLVLERKTALSGLDQGFCCLALSTGVWIWFRGQGHLNLRPVDPAGDWGANAERISGYGP